MTEVVEDRYMRQRLLVPEDKLNKMKITVVGVGAIGRQVALQLAAIGVRQLQLFDFDEVEIVNLAAQGFLEEDLGRPKVEAVADMCCRINSTIEVTAVNQRFRRSADVGDVVFSCVDSMAARKMIWQTVSKKVRLWADARMSTEIIRIITATDPQSHQAYEETLFTDEEAYEGSCTAKSTIFCSNVAAGMLVEQLSKYLRGMTLDNDFILNMLGNDIEII